MGIIWERVFQNNFNKQIRLFSSLEGIISCGGKIWEWKENWTNCKKILEVDTWIRDLYSKFYPLRKNKKRMHLNFTKRVINDEWLILKLRGWNCEERLKKMQGFLYNRRYSQKGLELLSTTEVPKQVTKISAI